MKKGTTVIASAIWILLLLTFSVNSRIIDIKTAKGQEDSRIYQSSWAADWYEEYWPNEDTVSEDVCDYIYDLFGNYSGFYQVTLYGTAGTIKSTILSNISFVNENRTYGTVFHYGHTYATYTEWGYMYYWGLELDIPVTHYCYIDSNSAQVEDHEIYPLTDEGIHYFIFLYSCGIGEEIGYYDDDYWEEYPPNYYLGTGAVGMPFAWHHTDDLSEDGYDDPDSTDYCFMGFEGWSKPLSSYTTTNNTYVYGDFVNKFYQRAVQYNQTFNDALDDASYYIWFTECGWDEFADTDLYNGYTDSVPEKGNLYGQMHVYGNGNNDFY